MDSTLKESDYVKAWALNCLSATIGGLVAGFIVGALMGAVLGGMGVPMQTIKIACGITGFIVGLPISYMCFHFFVSRFLIQKITDQATLSQTLP